MSPNRPVSCEHGDCEASLEDTSMRIRRGERVLAVPQKLWSCAHCRDPDTGGAQRFTDPSLREINQALADAAWREHDGEALPTGVRPGRKPAEPLEVRGVALLPHFELIRDTVRQLVDPIAHDKAN